MRIKKVGTRKKEGVTGLPKKEARDTPPRIDGTGMSNTSSTEITGCLSLVFVLVLGPPLESMSVRIPSPSGVPEPRV